MLIKKVAQTHLTITTFDEITGAHLYYQQLLAT
jgi:hypothetical protein